MINTVKIPYLLPLLLLPLFTPGCAHMAQLLPPVAGEADPTVVRAEQMAGTAFKVVDAFLKYEKDNRASLQMNNISLKVAADNLRVQFPPAFRDFNAMISLYKGNRTPENRSLLNSSIEIIRGLVSVAETHLAGGVLYPASPNGAPPPPQPMTKAEIDAQEIKNQLFVITEQFNLQLQALRASNARILTTLKNHGLTNEVRALPPPPSPPTIRSTNETINPNADRQNR